MSLSGLNSGLYQQFSRYAEITDKAIIELNEDVDYLQDNRRLLGNLFVDLDSLRLNNVSARLIWVLLTEEMKVSARDIAEAGERLLRIGDRTEKVKDLLENLAHVLAEEQDNIRLRLRRGLR